MAAKGYLVNERIRVRIRKIRLQNHITMTDLARKLRMPISSYASMETGQCRISLDHLYRILGALDTDIGEIWPTVNTTAESQSRHYLCRLQEFRLNELISFSEAEGGGVFHVRGERCKVLFHENLSDFLIDRLAMYFESDLAYTAGTLLSRRDGDDSLHVFLKSENCPRYVVGLAQKYLALWAGPVRTGGLLEGANQSELGASSGKCC